MLAERLHFDYLLWPARRRPREPAVDIPAIDQGRRGSTDFHAEFGKIGVEATDKGARRALFIWLAGPGEGIERFLRRLRQRDIAVELRRFRIFLELVQLLENLIGRISVS